MKLMLSGSPSHDSFKQVIVLSSTRDNAAWLAETMEAMLKHSLSPHPPRVATFIGGTPIAADQKALRR